MSNKYIDSDHLFGPVGWFVVATNVAGDVATRHHATSDGKRSNALDAPVTSRHFLGRYAEHHLDVRAIVNAGFHVLRRSH